MAAQQPSVGRVVHYVSRGSADGVFGRECRAAIITAVDQDNPEAIVDLCVLNPGGMFFDRDVVSDEDEHGGGTWHWPERV